MKTIAIYCASSDKIHPDYFADARQIATLLVKAGYAIVNGGGRMGLMGEINTAAIEAGGSATGVIPRFMDEAGRAHTALTRKIVTEDMHTRKRTMASMASAVIALPGGVGTFEEVTEIMTWQKLGLFHGPVIILNTRGYYDPLIEMLRRSITEGFTSPRSQRGWHIVSTPAQALEAIQTSLPLNRQ